MQFATIRATKMRIEQYFAKVPKDTPLSLSWKPSPPLETLDVQKRTATVSGDSDDIQGRDGFRSSSVSDSVESWPARLRQQDHKA